MFSLSYILIFPAAAAFVFGVATLIEKKPVTATIRLGSEPNRFLNFFARRFQTSEKERLKKRIWLLQAGFEGPDVAQDYMVIRLLLTVSLPLALSAILPFVKPDITAGSTMLFALAAAAVGLIAPSMYVGSRRKRNQRAVRDGLPDALDLLLVCSEAGLGLDTAILKVGEELAPIHPIISKYLLQISSELRAGRPRAEAFRGFGDRTGIQETTSLVNLLVQTDALGTSMAATLRAFVDDMRAHRLLRAEEQGQKVAVKLTLILASCLLPALMIGILTPVGNKILHTSFKMYVQ
jgi:tight adherence protein C